MKKLALTITLLIILIESNAQTVPMDTAHLAVNAQAHIFENHMGEEAIYLKGGIIALKDVEFLNGTIEYDIHLKEEQSFPGLYFRYDDKNQNGEEFYIRPHLSGKPDANQTAALTHGITAWQLYFGPKYSFPYEYNYDTWTHVKIAVDGDRAQVFLDHASTPNLSWKLFHESKAGMIVLRGGNGSGMHIANISVDQDTPELADFEPKERQPIPGIIETWSLSDKFEENKLEDPSNLKKVISDRKWVTSATIEEGAAVNISRSQRLRDGQPGNTVFARVEITSDSKQLKLLDFGYSDRAVVILNGKPIYRGNNRWRSRDYRYLGTIGLFDSVYLDLNKGKNELLIAVSEDFGGWLVTGRIGDTTGVSIK